MTGGKRTRKTQKPLRRARVGELRPWSELPTELLELIVSRLCIEDNVRLSCVCKKLRYVVGSLRVVNQSPWLMFPPALDGTIRFFDPSQGKFYFDELPEIRASVIHCSKDGWVLLSSEFCDRIFLFNPFTLSIIDLPFHSTLKYETVRAALSCAPTSPDCVVFTIRADEYFLRDRVSIGICHPGDAQWTTVKYHNTDDAFFCCGDGPVFYNGLFYCLSQLSDNLVGVFDPQKHTWSILPVAPPNFPPLSYGQRREANHMVEFKGQLLLVSVSMSMDNPDKPIIFKLELSKMKWVEMESLNGVTVFVSSRSSLSATDVPRISRNSVYFSKPRCYGKSSYLYSFDDRRFHPANQRHDCRKNSSTFPKAVWIELPKMSHLLFEELY